MEESALSTAAGLDRRLLLQIEALTRVSVGETITIPLRVLNASDLVVRALTTVGPADVAAWFEPPPELFLYPGQSSTVTLTVTVPMRPDLLGSRVTFAVEVSCEPEPEAPVSVAEAALEIWTGSARPAPPPPAPPPPAPPSSITDEPPTTDAATDATPAPATQPRRRWWRRGWRPWRRRPDTEWRPPALPVEEDQEAMVVLSDQPVGRYEDELGFQQMASQLAQVVLSPSTSTPFTVGIEGGWGSGKSTLMRLVEESLTDRSLAGPDGTARGPRSIPSVTTPGPRREPAPCPA